MFRRHWSGLPADPEFPDDLEGLRLFINDDDEIRMIDNPDNYFKFHITKNDRWNARHGFSFHEAMQKIIKSRLSDAGFTTVRLPLDTPADKPHVPILTSPNTATASRVIVLFGETYQPLGCFARRVMNGRGGINRGSVVGLARALRSQRASATDQTPPGLVVANPGELWWWPEGKHGLTQVDRHRIPLASAVHGGRKHIPEMNEIPENRNAVEHVKSVFEKVILGDGFVRPDAKIDIITVGDTAGIVETYLDDDAVLDRLGGRLNSIVILGGTHSSKELKTERFKQFLRERGRAYIIHRSRQGNLLAGPSGNPAAAGFTEHGCPVYSAGLKARYIETLPIETQELYLAWMQEVALQGEAYKNEQTEIFGDTGEEENHTWAEWARENGQEMEELPDHCATCRVCKGEAKPGYEDTELEPEASAGDINGSAKEVSTALAESKANTKTTGVAVIPGENVLGSDSAGAGPDVEEMKELVEEVEDLRLSRSRGGKIASFVMN